jgi:tetratricopeptide (TPR) repeat protein
MTTLSLSHRPHAPRNYSTRVRIIGGLLIAVLFLSIGLLVLELGLLFAGFGKDSRYWRLVQSDDGERWYRENRECTHRFFPQKMIRRPQPMRIPEVKERNTVRIVILGSSAAMGDPEASFSIARVLQCLLTEAYPALRFEVVNAAITAINSHVVVRIAEDVARLQPDLLVVYEGNNEVIGPFGPTGVLVPFLNSRTVISIYLWFRGLRTVQWFNQLSDGFSDRNSGVSESWGGMAMFLQHSLDRDDPRLSRVEGHFRKNLQSIVKLGEAVGAGVLLCTVLTNEKDFAPFLSLAPPRPESSDSWLKTVRSGDGAMQSGNWEDAIMKYRSAMEFYDQSASLHFRLGRALLAAGRIDDAAESFAEARDRDTLRFRTDSRLNEVIRSVGDDLGDRSELVDLSKDLATFCSQGILGDELLYEHVHLNFQGTYLVAVRLLDAVRDWISQEHMDGIAQPARVADYAEVRLRLGYTLYEQFLITHELLQRFRAPPFNQQEDAAIRLQLWSERWKTMEELLKNADQQERIFAHYRQALELNPEDWVLQRNFGMALVGLGRAEEAIPWLEKARAWISDDPDLLFALATAYDRTHRSIDGRSTWTALRGLEPRYPGLPER